MSPPGGTPHLPPSAARALEALLASEAAAALREAARGVPAHAVGGAVRDAVLGRPSRDFDAVVEREGAGIAARLAERLAGRSIALGGDAFAAWRVARRGLVVDLWDRRGAPLTEELERRDATVNAVALDLATGELVDPCNGLDDLAHGLLRAPRPGACAEDPLRVLRLARLEATLPGFRIESGTASAARAAAPRLEEAAPERVRVELELALAVPRGEALRSALAEVGLHPGLWLGRPGVGPASEPTRRRFVALAAAARFLVAEFPAVAPRVDPLTLHGALLALDLEGMPAPAALDGLRRRGWLARRRAHAMGLLFPWTAPPATTPERRWLLHATGGAWPSGLLVAATQPSPGEAWHDLARELVRLAERHGEAIFDPPALLDGLEVGRLTGVSPGPELGRWVGRLRRAQVEGLVSDEAEARRWLASESLRPS